MYGSVVLYPNGGWPPNFSGTNCKVIGTVGAGGPAWVTDALMKIDGVLVRTYTDTGQHAPYVRWTVNFASSQVPDDNSISFRVYGHNNLGQVLDYTKGCQAYNKASSLGNSTLSFGVTAKTDMGGLLSQMNHTTITSNTLNKSGILTEIPIDTAFYIYTHAGPGWFKDCPNTSTITAADVTTAVQSKTSSQPKYNFVHIDGCNSCGSVGAEDSSLATAFGITGGDDQAFLGWLSLVADSENNENWSKTVWTNVKSGMTINGAITETLKTITPRNTDGSVASWKIFGDGRTTLHNTYFLGPTGSWHD